MGEQEGGGVHGLVLQGIYEQWGNVVQWLVIQGMYEQWGNVVQGLVVQAMYEQGKCSIDLIQRRKKMFGCLVFITSGLTLIEFIVITHIPRRLNVQCYTATPPPNTLLHTRLHPPPSAPLPCVGRARAAPR